jgi:hypothetical protein
MGFALTLSGVTNFVWRGAKSGHTAFQSIKVPKPAGALLPRAAVAAAVATAPTELQQRRDVPDGGGMVHIGPNAPRMQDVAKYFVQGYGGSAACDDVAFAVDAATGEAASTRPAGASDRAASVSGGTELRNNASVSGTVPLGKYHYYQARECCELFAHLTF